MKQALHFLVLAAVAPGAAPPSAPPPAAAPAAEPGTTAPIIVRKCVLEYDQSTQFSAPSPSLLHRRPVKLGDKVKAGQVLGTYFDQSQRAILEQAKIDAESDVAVRIAKNELARARLRVAKSETLGKRSFISAEQLSDEKLGVDQAQLAVEAAEQKHSIAQAIRHQAEADLRALSIVAPHDGVVIETVKNEGESVTIGDPVMRIVNLDRLRVLGQINVTDLWRIKVGDPVQVTPEIAGADLEVERETFTGKIAFIDSAVDPATQTCKVHSLIRDDKHLLKSGLSATLVIFPREGATKEPAGGAAAPPRPPAAGPAPAGVVKGAVSRTPAPRGRHSGPGRPDRLEGLAALRRAPA